MTASAWIGSRLPDDPSSYNKLNLTTCARRRDILYKLIDQAISIIKIIWKYLFSRSLDAILSLSMLLKLMSNQLASFSRTPNWWIQLPFCCGHGSRDQIIRMINLYLFTHMYGGEKIYIHISHIFSWLKTDMKLKRPSLHHNTYFIICPMIWS